jgi:hypothetical protein
MPGTKRILVPGIAKRGRMFAKYILMGIDYA